MNKALATVRGHRTFLGYTLIYLLLLTLAVASTYQMRPIVVNEDVGPSGSVTVKLWRNGELIVEYTTHNVITTRGSKNIRNILGWNNVTNLNATDDISLGYEIVSKTLTKLTTEITGSGLVRTSGTATSVNDTAYQTTNTWSSITAPETINATGLHYDPTSDSDNNMIAVASITEVSVIAGDSLQVTWTFNIPDG